MRSSFIVARFVPYRYEVRRVADGQLVQSGQATPDEDAVITIPQVQVSDGGVRLLIVPTTVTGVTPDQAARRQPHLAMSRNPVQEKASLTIEWPGEGDGTVTRFVQAPRDLRKHHRTLPGWRPGFGQLAEARTLTLLTCRDPVAGDWQDTCCTPRPCFRVTSSPPRSTSSPAPAR